MDQTAVSIVDTRESRFATGRCSGSAAHLSAMPTLKPVFGIVNARQIDQGDKQSWGTTGSLEQLIPVSGRVSRLRPSGQSRCLFPRWRVSYRSGRGDGIRGASYLYSIKGVLAEIVAELFEAEGGIGR